MAGTTSEARGEEVEVARWYTGTRHIPSMIGKLPTGEKLPGGPYTVSQLVTMVTLFLALFVTHSAWSTANGVANLAILVMVPIFASWAVARVPWNMRSPMVTARALPTAWGAGQGRVRDVVCKVPKVHTERPVALLDRLDEGAPVVLLEPSGEVASVEPVQEPVSAPAAVDEEELSERGEESELEATGGLEPPRSAVQALLAGAARRS